MKEINMTIRPIEKSDYPDIAAIYNYYVENSNAAFLETNMDVEFVESLHKAALKNSFLVADNEEKVVGFCLLKSFLPMENFKRTATITYFISLEYTRCGVGNLFLNELLQYANDNHIDNFIAEIASDNIQSITFHKKQGFQECGTLNKVGFKKNKDLSILYMQKDIKQGYG
ncbi:MAG: N-acetyltransferase family protein [Tannerellaceae bacterium]|nr:N-acetyltransferase family protein [Tannerellaceae bacterium]